jgi:hypothetical protein
MPDDFTRQGETVIGIQYVNQTCLVNPQIYIAPSYSISLLCLINARRF